MLQIPHVVGSGSDVASLDDLNYVRLPSCN